MPNDNQESCAVEKKNNIITKIFGCDKEPKWNQSDLNF